MRVRVRPQAAGAEPDHLAEAVAVRRGRGLRAVTALRLPGLGEVEDVAADGPLSEKGLPSFRRGEELYFGHPFGLTNRAGVIERLVGEGTRINPGAEDSLAQAAQSASGPRRSGLSSLLQDFRAANQQRAANRETVLRLQAEYDGNPGASKHPAAPFESAINEDGNIDRAEQAVADRASAMLTEVGQELALTSRFDRRRVRELMSLRDTLSDVVTGARHIEGYKQAPYR